MASFSQYFPVGLSCQWQSRSSMDLPTHLYSWLTEAGSLTARLKAGASSFKVEVLGQENGLCSETEATDGILAGDKVIIREVLLYCDEKPHVFARSLLPYSSLTGEEAKLADVGDQPLGHLLFKQPNLRRGDIELATFDSKSSVANIASKFGLTVEHELWGRRSHLSIDDKPILVAEVFLPGAAAYAEGVQRNYEHS